MHHYRSLSLEITLRNTKIAFFEMVHASKKPKPPKTSLPPNQILTPLKKQFSKSQIYSVSRRTLHSFLFSCSLCKLVDLWFSLYLQWIHTSIAFLLPFTTTFIIFGTYLGLNISHSVANEVSLSVLWGDIWSYLFCGLLLSLFSGMIFPTGKNLWAMTLVLGVGTMSGFSLSDSLALGAESSVE